MINDLIGRFEGDTHVRQHPLFAFMRTRRLTQKEQLGPYLASVGALRKAMCIKGRFISSLNRMELPSVAKIAESVIREERRSTQTFAQMTKLLVNRRFGWMVFPDKGEAVERMMTTCAQRMETAPASAIYSLTAMLPLALAFNRQIIPSQVTAFAGPHGWNIKVLPYLARQSGDDGIAARHEKKLLEALASVPPLYFEAMGEAMEDVLRRLKGFYDHLLNIWKGH